MDALDERLVTLLRHDGRRSICDLAVDLNVSRATVRARMERLERSGEILGYTVILRSEAVDLPLRGMLRKRYRSDTSSEHESHVSGRSVTPKRRRSPWFLSQPLRHPPACDTISGVTRAE